MNHNERAVREAFHRDFQDLLVADVNYRLSLHSPPQYLASDEPYCFPYRE